LAKANRSVPQQTEPATPSHETTSSLEEVHEAIESDNTANEAGERAQRRIDEIAMESAKRSTNRIHADEERLPGDTIFSK
jgi:hypothetical protein